MRSRQLCILKDHYPTKPRCSDRMCVVVSAFFCRFPQYLVPLATRYNQFLCLRHDVPQEEEEVCLLDELYSNNSSSRRHHHHPSEEHRVAVAAGIIRS